MSEKKITTIFQHTQIGEFKGEVKTARGSVQIGIEEDELAPYDLLLGALASCYYATFLEIAEKKRINFSSVEIQVTGRKKEEVPTTLEWVKLEIIVFGVNVEKQKGLEQAAELAGKYCSIYQTISHVAKMEYEIQISE
ncbi:MAG: OsmC family protein [Spirochaetes bacterium]|nr:OsmC family protein [Spirochaetota bacterium]